MAMNANPHTVPAPGMRFCPSCGADKVRWLTSKEFQCLQCGFTLFFNPVPAVAVLIECAGRLLFTLRALDPGKGMLDLPGGFVDPGETAEEAVRREIKEELDLTASDAHYLFTALNQYPFQGVTYQTLDLFFHIRLNTEPNLRPSHELSAVTWLRCGEVDWSRIAFQSIREGLQRFWNIAGSATSRPMKAKAGK